MSFDMRVARVTFQRAGPFRPWARSIGSLPIHQHLHIHESKKLKILENLLLNFAIYFQMLSNLSIHLIEDISKNSYERLIVAFKLKIVVNHNIMSEG